MDSITMFWNMSRRNLLASARIIFPSFSEPKEIRRYRNTQGVLKDILPVVWSSAAEPLQQKWQ